MNLIINFIYRFLKDFAKNDVVGTAAQTAFFLTLSIPPTLVLALSVSTNITMSESITSLFEYLFPTDVYNIFSYVIETLPQSRRVTIISAMGVVFSASGSTWALMRGIHKAYTNEKLSYTLKNRLHALMIMVLFVFVIVVSLGSLIIGGVLTALLSRFSDIELFSYLNIFSTVAVLYVFVHFLYKATPNVNLKGRNLFWGALFSAVGWVSVSALFGIYINQFTKYTTVYGGIGAFFILILWLYVICFILLTGAQINGTLSEYNVT